MSNSHWAYLLCIVSAASFLAIDARGKAAAQAKADEWYRAWKDVSSKYHDLLTYNQPGVLMHEDGSVSFAHDTVLGTGTVNGVTLTEANTIRTPDGRIRFFPPKETVVAE